MKRILTLATLAAGLLSACVEDPSTVDETDPGGEMTIYAGPQTKSVISGDKVLWVKTDTLLVFDESGKGTKFSTVDDNTETARFTTPSWEGGRPSYAACYYPDYKENFVMDCSPDGLMTIKFRPEQRVLWRGTCARQATASVGIVEEDGGKWCLHRMMNIMGFISLNVINPDVRKIVVEAIGGEYMAGWVDVDYTRLAAGAEDFWTPSPGRKQSTSVTLTCSDNAANADGCFKPGKYYVSMMPQVYAQGLKFTMYGAGGEIILTRTTGEVVMGRSEVRDISSPIDDELPDTIVLDMDFYNTEGVNPLGFGDLTAAEESPEGETYDFCGFPVTVCKGSQSDARYRFRSLSLIYPAGVTGNCLVFEKQNSWIGLPGIRGHVLHSVTYEHGNGYVKRMVIKKSLDPSVTIAYTSNDEHFIATADGPDSETISFYSNGTTDVSVTGSPGVGEPVFLQFITSGGTRIYRIKATYMRELPPVPGPSGVTGDFPRVSIHTAGAAPIVSKEDYVYGSFEYSDPGALYPGVNSVVENDVARFRGRGNTTWNRFPKKPYKIKLDGKVSFFGLPKDKEWCLLANYSDKSLLRNIVAMKISSILGFGWTPQMRTVELWLNDVYQGAYTLSEHKKISSDRIDITVPEDGGRDMYLEIDQLMDETTCFRTERYNVPVMYSDPEIPDEEMLSETKDWFKGLEDALAAEPIGDYASFIDVPSFIDHYIIQELAKNVDGRMNKGCFITRSQGGPLKVCHEWDFDISFGNCNTLSTLSGVDNGPTGVLIREFTGALKGDGWYPRLFSDPTFVSAVKARWNEVYTQLCTIPSFIDEQAAIIAPAAERNFIRWPILGQYVWPNVSWPATYGQEVGNLKSFYSARLTWLDGNINSL